MSDIKLAPKVEKSRSIRSEDKTPVVPMKPGPDGRIPNVDRAGYDKKIDALESELKTLMNKQSGLSTKINDKTGGKDEFVRERDLFRSQLDAKQAEINKIDEEKKKIQVQVDAKFKEGDAKKRETNDLKSKVGYNSVEEVDRKIAEIEYKMHTESLGIKKERELIQEISKLKQVKPEILKLKNLRAGVKMDDSIGALKAEQNALYKQINELRDEKRKIQASLNKVMDARKKTMSGVSDLVDSRTETFDAVRALRDQIRALKDEKFTAIRSFQAGMAEAKVARAERDKIEKAYKDAESARRKLEFELENENALPFMDKIELAQNTIKYCKTLVPEEKKVEEKKTAEVKSLPGTSAVLLKKSDREANFFFAPTKVNKKQSNKTSEAKTLTHSLDTISLFATLKLSAPAAPKDVPATITSLEAKIADLEKKQVEIIAERKSKRTEKEEELAAATKVADAAKVEWLKVAPKESIAE